MKFYKRFPGDIQIKTGGLSMAEFGAYDRLLDHYYATEVAIEAGEVYSITRAQGKADREAVDKVLRRYFVVDQAGNYVQERANEMIAEALPKIAAAKKNGKLGGRPTGSTKKPTGLILETYGETKTLALAKGSQNQNQKEQEKPPHPPAGGADGFSRFWSAWPKHVRKVAQLQCRKKWESKACEPIADAIVAHVEAMKKAEAWAKNGGEFIPAPLVYLNQSRWEAETVESRSNTVAPAETLAQYMERSERQKAEREAERLKCVNGSKQARDAAVERIKRLKEAA